MKVETRGRGHYALTRVFLEKPQPDEQITATALDGKLFFPRELEFNPSANGQFQEVDPGGFSAIEGKSSQMKLGAPGHFPFVKTMETPEMEIESWGDVLLRRPPKNISKRL